MIIIETFARGCQPKHQPKTTAPIEHGVALAKATNAKVTALTVSAPFNGLSLAPGIVLD